MSKPQVPDPGQTNSDSGGYRSRSSYCIQPCIARLKCYSKWECIFKIKLCSTLNNTHILKLRHYFIYSIFSPSLSLFLFPHSHTPSLSFFSSCVLLLPHFSYTFSLTFLFPFSLPPTSSSSLTSSFSRSPLSLPPPHSSLPFLALSFILTLLHFLPYPPSLYVTSLFPPPPPLRSPSLCFSCSGIRGCLCVHSME